MRASGAAVCCALAACAGTPASRVPAASAPIAAASAAASASACARTPSAAVLDLRYELAVDAALGAMDARVCFRGPAPTELVCGLHGGASALEGAWAESEGGRKPLAIEHNAIVVDGVGADGCVGYRLDLARTSDVGGLDAVRRDGVLVMNTALWLVRPRDFAQVRSIRVKLALPEGMRAELPWPVEGDELVPDRSALAYYGHALLGRFELERFEVQGARIEVAIPPGFSAQTRAALVPWLRTAVEASALAIGRVPAERVAVIVVPDAPGDRPVRFGTVARGGGASLLLFVPRDATLATLRGDWVAVHELSHLLHPFVDRDDAWLPEGIATYYQELLRVRAGLLPEEEGWRRIVHGARLGRDAEHGLSDESADMFVTFQFSRVYWGGATFALLADLELRRRSGGAQSLDDVVDRLNACCARSPTPWSARALLERMDAIAGAPVFSQLAEQVAYGPRFPDVEALLPELGIRVDAEATRVTLDASAPSAGLRSAIMTGRACSSAAGLSQHPPCRAKP